MSTSQHNPAAGIAFQHDAATIGRAPRAAHAFGLAQAANHALLDVCPRCCFASELEAGTYSFGYTPSPHARWLWVEWVAPPQDVKAGSYALDAHTAVLTIRDTSGGSWSGSRPPGFAGESTLSTSWDGQSLFTREVRRGGWVDLDAARAALTGTDWTLEMVFTTDSYVSRLQAWECPRFSTDDSAADRGCVPGAYAPHAPILDGTTTSSGLERILATVESARKAGRTYLSLTWPEDITLAIPQRAGTSEAPLTNLEQYDGSTTTYVSWTIRVRRLYAAATAGEAIRWRVRYRFDGGTTETATAYLYTGATGSPWSVTLSYTASWTWSAWQTTASVPTDGTDTLATLGVQAKISASGPTFYMAGIQVEEAAT